MLPVALVALLGCPHQVTSLADEQKALAAQEGVPMPADWSAQATVVVGQPLLQRLVSRAAEAAKGVSMPDLTTRTPLGIEVHAIPHPQTPDIALKAVTDCPYCIGADVDMRGKLDLSMTSQLGGLSGAIPWHAKLGATMRVEGQPGPKGLAIVLEPIHRDQWTLAAGLDTSSTQIVNLFGSLLQQRLRQALVDGPLAAPMMVATVPTDQGVRLRGLRAYVHSGLAVDLGFAALRSGRVTSIPDPGDGFVVVMPADTVLGLVQGNLLRGEPIHGFIADPQSLTLQDGRFKLDVRVWKSAEHESWREYTLEGTLGLDEQGVIGFHPDEVSHGTHRGWITPVHPLVQGAVLAAMQKSCAVDVPGKYVQQVGDKQLVVDITRLYADEDVLTLWGKVE